MRKQDQAKNNSENVRLARGGKRILPFPKTAVATPYYFGGLRKVKAGDSLIYTPTLLAY